MKLDKFFMCDLGAEDGGGGGAPEVVADGSGNYTIKVNGQEKQVTLEDALRAAEKVGGADQRFNEASELKKEAERMREEAHQGIRMKDLYTKISTQAASRDEIVEYCDLMGVTEADRDYMLGEGETLKDVVDTAIEDTGSEMKMDNGTLQQLVDAIVTIDKKVSDLTSQSERVAPLVQERSDQDLLKQINNVLDKNEDFKYIIGKTDTAKVDSVSRTIADRCFNEVSTRLKGGVSLNASLLEDAVKKEVADVRSLRDTVQSSDAKNIAIGIGSRGAFIDPSIVDSVSLDEKIDVTGDGDQAAAFAKGFVQHLKREGLEGARTR